MWISSENYQVEAKERALFERRLKKEYKARGFRIEVDRKDKILSRTGEAQIVYYFATGTFRFFCGSFWTDANNLIPVIAMAHELGHYIDYEQKGDDMLDYMTNGKTMDKEVGAWMCAVDVLNKIKFDHWNVFFEYAYKCLTSYYENMQSDVEEIQRYTDGLSILRNKIEPLESKQITLEELGLL
jgi:hypothetical protein